MLSSDENQQAVLQSKGMAGATIRWTFVKPTASKSAVLVYLWKRAIFNKRLEDRPKSGVGQANLKKDTEEKFKGTEKMEAEG